MIDVKAIREAAEAAESRNWTHGANPATVLALCDEVERLRNGMYNIANQATEPAIQAFARSYLEAKQ